MAAIAGSAALGAVISAVSRRDEDKIAAAKISAVVVKRMEKRIEAAENMYGCPLPRDVSSRIIEEHRELMLKMFDAYNKWHAKHTPFHDRSFEAFVNSIKD